MPSEIMLQGLDLEQQTGTAQVRCTHRETCEAGIGFQEHLLENVR
jgi:hypothetical protein